MPRAWKTKGIARNRTWITELRGLTCLPLHHDSERSRQESNLDSRVRNPACSPLHYGLTVRGKKAGSINIRVDVGWPVNRLTYKQCVNFCSDVSVGSRLTLRVGRWTTGTPRPRLCNTALRKSIFFLQKCILSSIQPQPSGGAPDRVRYSRAIPAI